MVVLGLWLVVLGVRVLNYVKNVQADIMAGGRQREEMGNEEQAEACDRYAATSGQEETCPMQGGC